MALKPTTTIRKRNMDASGQKLVDILDEIQTKINALVTLTTELKTDHNALATKLDSDAGVTDTNYNSTTGITSPTVTV